MPMLSAATSSPVAAPSFAAYDRSGRATALLRSEPVKPIAAITPSTAQGSTTTAIYQDQVTLSADGVEKSRREQTGTSPAQGEGEANKDDRQAETAGPAKNDRLTLSPEEQKMVAALQQRDREVRTHEQAHLANAGQYARGGPSYSFQQGPDGRRYAIGGEVPIDTSPEPIPEQTILKMEAIKRAAMAPAEPSSTDRSVAAAAAALEARARQEIQAEAAETAPGPDQAAAPEDSDPAAPTDPVDPGDTRRNQRLDTVA